ncbi:MAG: phage minor head protein [Verrucomicrobiota bacterium]|nr:phage minor head protein [Verrucomicrobiota bacterium]
MPANPPDAGVPPHDAIEYFRSKGMKPSFDYRDVWREEHATAFTVAKSTGFDILVDIRTALDDALANGKTFETFKKELTPTLQAKGWWGIQKVQDPVTGSIVDAQLGSPRRLQTIYRANIRTAMAAGQWERAQRTKRALPYFVYELGPSEHHREAHAAIQGTMLPVDDPFWDSHFPPNGWGCKCWLRQVSKFEYDKLNQNGVPVQGDPILDSKGIPTGRRKIEIIPAKTTAPKVPLIDWLNSRTGQIEKVPQGIDPGWDTNPGKSRQSQATTLLATKEAATKAKLAAPLPPAPGIPKGTPVSSAADVQFRIKSTAQKIHATFASIDSVHGDGTLARIPINNKVSRKSDGTYWSSPHSAGSIGVKNAPAGMEFHLTHEVGHWLDHIALPGHKFSSNSNHPAISALMNAIKSTQSISLIRSNATITEKYRRYLLSPNEMFARAYAQFIATNSKNPKMLEWLNSVRDGKTNYIKESQWSESDFAPVQTAFLDFFIKMGWIAK